MKKFMSLLAAFLCCVSFSACSDDDDEPEATVQEQMAGSYSKCHIRFLTKQDGQFAYTNGSVKAVDIADVQMTLSESGKSLNLSNGYNINSFNTAFGYSVCKAKTLENGVGEPYDIYEIMTVKSDDPENAGDASLIKSLGEIFLKGFNGLYHDGKLRFAMKMSGQDVIELANIKPSGDESAIDILKSAYDIQPDMEVVVCFSLSN